MHIGRTAATRSALLCAVATALVGPLSAGCTSGDGVPATDSSATGGPRSTGTTQTTDAPGSDPGGGSTPRALSAGGGHSADGPPASVPADALGVTSPGDCTGSVIDAGRPTRPGIQLVLTAAHCMEGSAAGWTFVVAPQGAARQVPVLGAYVDPTIGHGADPQGGAAADRDAAVLTVDTGADPLPVVGRVDTSGARAGQRVHVAGYAAQSPQRLDCDAGLRQDPDGPVVDCPGFAAGTSGSPWVLDAAPGDEPRVVGIVGGPEGGGCTDDLSRTPDLGPWVAELVRRAAADEPDDDVPAYPGDDCPLP